MDITLLSENKTIAQLVGEDTDSSVYDGVDIVVETVPFTDNEKKKIRDEKDKK